MQYLRTGLVGNKAIAFEGNAELVGYLNQILLTLRRSPIARQLKKQFQNSPFSFRNCWVKAIESVCVCNFFFLFLWKCYIASKFNFLVRVEQSNGNTWLNIRFVIFSTGFSGILQNWPWASRVSSDDGRICRLSHFVYPLRSAWPRSRSRNESGFQLHGIECGLARAVISLQSVADVREAVCCRAEVYKYRCKWLHPSERSSTTALEILGSHFWSWDRSRIISLRYVKRSLFLFQARKLFIDLRTWPKFGKILNY